MMIQTFAGSVVAQFVAPSPLFWLLFFVVVGIFVGVVMSCMWSYAAKIKAETVAWDLARERENERHNREALAVKAAENSVKLDQIGKQTDGNMSKVLEENKRLQAQFADMTKILSTLQGRVIERRNPDSSEGLPSEATPTEANPQ